MKQQQLYKTKVRYVCITRYPLEHTKSAVKRTTDPGENDGWKEEAEEAGTEQDVQRTYLTYHRSNRRPRPIPNPTEQLAPSSESPLPDKLLPLRKFHPCFCCPEMR